MFESLQQHYSASLRFALPAKTFFFYPVGEESNGNAQRSHRAGNPAQAVTCCCLVDYCLNCLRKKSAPNPTASKASDPGSGTLPGALTRIEKPLWSGV